MSEMEWKAASWVAALSATRQPCPELRMVSSKQVCSDDSALSAWAAWWHSLINWEHRVTSSCRELSLNSSPAPLQSVHKFQLQRHIITCDFTDTPELLQELVSCLTTLHIPSAECTSNAALRAFVLTGITCYKQRSIWPFSPEEVAN